MRVAPIGCPFAPRCRWRLDVCWTENPALRPTIERDAGRHDRARRTHQIACFNPPTDAERSAGRPLAPGFVRAAPPLGALDEVGAGHLGGRPDDFEGLVADIQHEEGQISLAPSAGGLPLPPEPEHHTDGINHDD